MVSAVILWGSATPGKSLRFDDALFLAVSAMTEAGLNTVNLSALNTFQQFWLFLLILLGSAIFVSAFVVQVRRAAFEQEFKTVAGRRRKQRRSPHVRAPNVRGKDQTVEKPSTLPSITDTTKQWQHAPDETASNDGMRGRDTTPRQLGVTFETDSHHDSADFGARLVQRRHRHGRLRMQGVGALPDIDLEPVSLYQLRPKSPDRDVDAGSNSYRTETMQDWRAFGGWVSRNSGFHGLTAKERANLGGYEYRAVCLLAWLVPAYYVLWQLLGALGCAAWVAYNRPETARLNGLNPWWVGAFNAVSAFNNSGMSLLDANMTAFQTGYYLLITMGLLILAGNTCYPIFLRLIVWTMWTIARQFRGPQWVERAHTVRFLLDHPRRCYTNLFPSQHTWWLLLSVVTLNGTDWAAFEILNIGNPQLESLPVHVRVIDGLFQAFAVRSGGFYVVNIPTLRISLQVLYVVMMYISVYPVTISLRNSNVYEERSLGLYSRGEESHPHELRKRQESEHVSGLLERMRSWRGQFESNRPVPKESNRRFVRHQLRAQLAHDAWVLVLALFLIMIIEADQFSTDPMVFSVFNFIFEIVSGYGCVGISTGVPWNNYSFCGSWHTLSKLILCVVMLRGRHRGLPVAIDKAVLLPDERGEEAEEEDGRIRVARAMSGRRRAESV